MVTPRLEFVSRIPNVTKCAGANPSGTRLQPLLARSARPSDEKAMITHGGGLSGRL
jgi:hypothetical protein